MGIIEFRAQGSGFQVCWVKFSFVRTLFSIREKPPEGGHRVKGWGCRLKLWRESNAKSSTDW